MTDNLEKYIYEELTNNESKEVVGFKVRFDSCN